MSFSFGKGSGNGMSLGDDSLSDTCISMKSNQRFRPAELETLTKIEQKEECGKNVIVIDTGAPLSKSTVEKVKKVISSTKQKPVGEEASKQAQIEEFLKSYKTSFNDVPVKDMRHIIPLLLMEVYVEKHGHYTKKVKGLWEKRPDDWPANVPFVDPNNRLKNEGEKNVKPKKELLGQMLTYLVERYRKMKKAEETSDPFLHANDPLLSFPNQSNTNTLNDNFSQYVLNLVETSELRAAEQSVSDQNLITEHFSGYSSSSGYQLVFTSDMQSSLSSMPRDGSLIQSSYSTMEDPLSGELNGEQGELVEDGPDNCFNMQWSKQMQPEVDVRPHKQVVDNEEDQSCMKDWNPLEEISERTRLKLCYMKMKVLVPQVMQDQLESIHGLLMKVIVAELDENAMFKLLEKWYKLEMCIDGVKFQQPCTYSKIIQDLLDELTPKAVPMMDFTSNMTLKAKENAAAYDEQGMDFPIPTEDPQQINSLLNIRPRPGPAGGMVSFPPGGQLEVRYLLSKQSGAHNGCGSSMLSDNHKPIQPAQEDGDAPTTISSNELVPLSDDEVTDFLLYLNQSELSLPVQESAPATQSTSQLAGNLEMPLSQFQNVMAGVSVQPWIDGNLAQVMSVPYASFSSVTAAPSQLISISSMESPSTAVAEECIKRLSLSGSVEPSPPPLLNTNPVRTTQPNLDQLLSKPRPVGKPGGKRSYPYDEDDELGKNATGTSQSAPAYNMLIPLVVEEMSNNLDKHFSRPLKKKTR